MVSVSPAANMSFAGGAELFGMVSNGTGYWGPPMRVGAPPEITLLELTSEA